MEKIFNEENKQKTNNSVFGIPRMDFYTKRLQTNDIVNFEHNRSLVLLYDFEFTPVSRLSTHNIGHHRKKLFYSIKRNEYTRQKRNIYTEIYIFSKRSKVVEAVIFLLFKGMSTLVNVYVALPVFTPVAGSSYAYFVE